MKIIVFNRDEKRIADLNPESIVSPKVIEDKDGLMLFGFSYSIKEEDVQALQGGNYVAFLDELDNVWKEYEITGTVENFQMLTVSCEHRYQELATEELVSWSVDGADSDVRFPMEYSLQGTRWNVGTIEFQRQLKRSVFEKNPLEALRFIEREYGGVLRFRIEITGSGNHEFFVDLLQRRGKFTGHRLEFGHNLKDFEHSVDFRLIKTAMYGRGKGQEIETAEDTQGLTFADVVWSVAVGDPVDKPLGQTWVGFEDKRLVYGKPDGQGGRKHAFGTWNSQAETPEGLLWETYFKLQEASEPVVNVSASIIELEKISPEFAHEQTRLGDENYLIARYEGRDISLVAEVIRTERNPDDYSQTVVELGNYLPLQSRRQAETDKAISLQQARAGIYERAAIITEDGKIPTTVLDGVIDAVQNEFHSSIGFVYQTGNGILVLNDDKDTGNPTKAMFITGGAFFLSNEKGPDGEFVWRTFGDGNGFVADEIVTGTLDAQFVNVINLNADNIVAGKVKGEFLEINGQTTFEEGYDPTKKLETVFQTSPPTNKNVIWVDTTDPVNPQWKVWDEGLQIWVLGPSGPRGPQGLEGLQGPQGDQGIEGPKGEDGLSSFTHIAYADNADGTLGFSTSDSSNKEFIGMYVDHTPTDSTDPSKYKWTLIKGADGADGIEGPAGEDGKTPYLHIAYATAADGSTGFSVSETNGKTYIGTYTDFVQADSLDYTKYKWAKFEGPRGPQGVEGPKGSDGQSLYTWVKYADTSAGAGMADNPTGKLYIGLAYNKTDPNESSTASDYSWSLIKGDQGAEGPAGEDGVTTYTWVKYADSADGTGLSDDPTGKRYLGLAYNKTIQTESTNKADYSWSPLYDNVQVGGRNIMTDSYLERMIAYTSATTLTRIDTDESEEMETDIIKCVANDITVTYFGFIHASADRYMKYELGKKYVLSFKARGNVTNFNYSYMRRDSVEGGNSSFASQTVTLSETEWTEITMYKDGPFDTNTGHFQIASRDVGTVNNSKWFEIAEVKFEEGTIKTPYTPSPEDVEAKSNDKLDDTVTNITTAYTTAIGNSETAINLDVSKKVTDAEGRMISYTDSKVTQTSDSFNIRFGTFEGTQDGHGNQLAEIYSYFKFQPTGLNIGKSDSPLNINISNQQMDFKDNGNIVAYINGQKMYINTAEILQSIIVGNHKIEKYNNEITLVKWVGV